MTWPSTFPANTLGFMQDQIQDELARSDLTTQTAQAINTAISHYQSERFFFSESRDLTFNTVQGQEFYTDADVSGISTLEAFDYLILYLGSIPWPLHRRQPIEIETLNQNGLMRGQPWNFAYYEQKIRLGPVPDTAYQMRIAAHIQVAAPTSQSDTANAWMLYAEKMIRSRAKRELYTHVIQNQPMALVMKAEEDEAFQTLKGRSNRLVGTGMISAMVF